MDVFDGNVYNFAVIENSKQKFTLRWPEPKIKKTASATRQMHIEGYSRLIRRGYVFADD
mgnify:CR=1 FL=1